jgi:hypothetical protein
MAGSFQWAPGRPMTVCNLPREAMLSTSPSTIVWAKYVYSTNMEGGVTLLTEPGATELTTSLIRKKTLDEAVARIPVDV